MVELVLYFELEWLLHCLIEVYGGLYTRYNVKTDYKIGLDYDSFVSLFGLCIYPIRCSITPDLNSFYIYRISLFSVSGWIEKYLFQTE